MRTKLFAAVFAIVVCGGMFAEARDIKDATLINLLEGQRLDIVCPKYFEGSYAYDPLLKYKNSSQIGGQMQLAIGPNRRFNAPPSMKIISSPDGNSFTYSFESVDASNAGEYSCDQKDTKDFVVSVFSGVSLRCPEVDVESVAELEPFSASCHLNKSGLAGVAWPKDFFLMYKGDEVVATDVADDGGRLTIKNAETPSDVASSLFMTRTDHRSGSRLSCTIPSLGLRCDAPAPNVTWSPDSPKILDAPAFLSKGASKRMRCAVNDSGNPPMDLVIEDLAHPEAILDGPVVDGKEIAFTYQSANIVEMANASIRCSAGNVSEDLSFLIAEGPESVRPDKEEINLEAGETFTMSCEAVGSNPSAVISYFINDVEVPAPESLMATPEMDRGAVSCQASNPMTNVLSPIAQVPIKVRFFVAETRDRFDNVLIKTGEDTSLFCPFRGNPAPSYSWSFNSSASPDADADIHVSSSTYAVFNASSSHAGVYTCSAANDLGSDSFAVQLLVFERIDDDSENSLPILEELPAVAVVIPIVIVVIVLVASVIAFLLRRKAVAGKMDVEKGNKEIRDLPDPDEDVTLLENHEREFSAGNGAMDEKMSPASLEDESFVVTESEPVTAEDADESREMDQEPSFDSQPPNQQELHPGDERL